MSVVDNPWVDHEVQRAPVAAPVAASPSWSVVGGISAEAAVACSLPVVLSDYQDDIVLVGAHGGAGTSTVAELTGLVDGGHVWPVSAPVANRVLVVARTNMAGLRAAQAAALRVYSGAVRGVDVVGVVLVADVPGRRIPRELVDMTRAVKAAFPTSITIDWVSELRLGKRPSRLSGRLVRAVDDIQALNRAGKE